MCALNCPAWSLQNSLVASVESADDEYTTMIRGLVHLAGCFHLTTNAYQGAPHPKMVDRNIWRWMRSKLPMLSMQISVDSSALLQFSVYWIVQ
eukprot:scaffold36233_cov58-Attheya_sp.AAC.3